MAKSLVGAVVLVLVASACGSSQSEDADGEIAAVACDSAEGTWTNVADEPGGFRDLPDLVTWTDEAGCLINAEFIFHRMGDAHCELENVEFISIGLPIGTPYTGPKAVPPGQDWMPEFVFNTDAAWDSEPAGVEFPVAELPTDAVDLRLRGSGGRTLHMAADESALWIIRGDTVREFVEPAQEIACA